MQTLNASKLYLVGIILSMLSIGIIGFIHTANAQSEEIPQPDPGPTSSYGLAPESERESKFEKRSADRIVNLGENIVIRMNAATDRLINIANRLDARMAIIEENGTDLSSQRIIVENTLNALQKTKAQLGNMRVNVESIVYSGTPREVFNFTKVTFGEHKEALKLSQTQLRHALEQTKAILEPETNNIPAQDEATTEDEAGGTTE